MTSRSTRRAASSHAAARRRLGLSLTLGLAALGAAHAAPVAEAAAWQLRMQGELLAREQAALSLIHI